MIATILTKMIYLGNGATNEFPIPFKYSAPETVKVGIYDPKTDQTVPLTRDYYVDRERNAVFYPGYAPGQAPAEHEQPGPLPAGKKIVVYRETPLTQEIDLGTKYPLPVVEKMNDKNTMLTQELAEKLGRAVLADIGSGKTVEDIQREIREDRLTANTAAENATAKADEANTAAALARAWAEAAGPPDGQPESKSAKTWTTAAKDAASSAEESAKKASASESAASTSAGAAKTWAGKAEESAGKAQASAVTATEQSGKAQDSEAHAATSKTDANKSAVEAKLAAEEAASAAEKAKQIAGGNFATPEEVEAKISALVNQAPETLNTLSEIASALGNDPNFATTITALVGKKLGKTEVAAGAERLTISGKLGAELKAGVGILVLNRIGNSTNFEMVPTPGKNVTVGTAENCTGNAATATTAGTAAQASVAHSVPGSDVGGNIWIA